MNILKDELLIHHSFLKLTREHPSELPASWQMVHAGLTFTLKDTGILQIEPENPGPLDIILSSGIHGNETAGIEICDLLVREILQGMLLVKNRILVIIGNPHAMNKGIRFEQENMNRLFCSKYLGKNYPEAKRAQKLEQSCVDFYNSEKERCHFDLHTAIRSSKYEKFAIYPYQDGRDWNKKYLNFFKDSDIETILLGHQPASTFSYYSSQKFQANAFTVELGQVKPFGENELAAFSSIIDNFRLLISNHYVSSKTFNNDDFNLFQVVDEVFRHSDAGFALNISSDIANFSEFPIGFQLTTDDNGGYQFKSANQAIVFPNAQVSKGQRVALIVSKTNI